MCNANVATHHSAYLGSRHGLAGASGFCCLLSEGPPFSSRHSTAFLSGIDAGGTASASGRSFPPYHCVIAPAMEWNARTYVHAGCLRSSTMGKKVLSAGQATVSTLCCSSSLPLDAGCCGITARSLSSEKTNQLRGCSGSESGRSRRLCMPCLRNQTLASHLVWPESLTAG